MPSRLIIALDYPDAASALAMADRLDPSLCALKVGKELFTASGPPLVRECVARGYRVFLDLKFHDIPNTVAGACAAATRLGVWMLNVHASGGPAMLAAARQAVTRTASESGAVAPLLIAVTVLTSLSAADLEAVGCADAPARQALRLAKLAQSHGLDGVVCSPKEAAGLREACGAAFKLVTPGIRLAGAAADDQTRIATPAAAVHAGADFLVIGRPVTQSPDPRATLAAIAQSLGERP
jgi:orotidine-5'-phosphate decarboxylase